MRTFAELEPEPLTQPVASSAWRRFARIDLPAPVQKGWKTVSSRFLNGETFEANAPGPPHMSMKNETS